MARFVSAVLVLAVFWLTVLADEQTNLPMSQQCLACICEALTSCDTNAGCVGAVCGPFSISWPDWADAGMHTVNNESPQSPTAFTNCGLDTYCSIMSLQSYMKTFQQDCTGDGKIDCDDFIAIHKLGPYGCKLEPMRGSVAEKYQRCKAIVGALTPD